MKRGSRGGRYRQMRPRRPPPNWLREVKGCMVCGKECHIASQRHSEDEVREEIRKLKQKQHTALRTEDDIAFVTEMFDESKTESDDEDNNDAYYEEEDEVDSDIVYIATGDLETIHLTLNKVAFLHGRVIQADIDEMIAAMYSSIVTKDRELEFNSIKIDTAANRKSIMSTKTV